MCDLSFLTILSLKISASELAFVAEDSVADVRSRSSVEIVSKTRVKRSVSLTTNSVIAPARDWEGPPAMRASEGERARSRREKRRGERYAIRRCESDIGFESDGRGQTKQRQSQSTEESGCA